MFPLTDRIGGRYAGLRGLAGGGRDVSLGILQALAGRPQPGAIFQELRRREFTEVTEETAT